MVKWILVGWSAAIWQERGRGGCGYWGMGMEGGDGWGGDGGNSYSLFLHTARVIISSPVTDRRLTIVLWSTIRPYLGPHLRRNARGRRCVWILLAHYTRDIAGLSIEARIPRWSIPGYKAVNHQQTTLGRGCILVRTPTLVFRYTLLDMFHLELFQIVSNFFLYSFVSLTLLPSVVRSGTSIRELTIIRMLYMLFY